MPHTSNPLTFQTLGLATIDLSCKRLLRVEETKGGKTSSKAEAKFIQRDTLKDSLFAQVTINIIGKPNDRPEESSFSIQLTIESQILFPSQAPDPNDLSPEIVKSIFEPLFFTALERCRANIWQMGYGGVRLPIKQINFNSEAQQKDDLEKPPKKRARTSKQRSQIEPI
jgi:hypothetical protein